VRIKGNGCVESGGLLTLHLETAAAGSGTGTKGTSAKVMACGG
jgi:hypothetical protein